MKSLLSLSSVLVAILFGSSLLSGCFISSFAHSVDVSTEQLLNLRDETKGAFFHAYNSYLKYAYPHDEIKPISCRPRTHLNKIRGTLDDVLGGYMLTLVDSLDSILLMQEYERFDEALYLMKDLTFERDVNVSVFEANIRVLGGLLSAHQLACIAYPKVKYDGKFLLHHAEKLAMKLLPAFETKTGIPVHLINLKKGIIPQVQRHTCTAAGGTYLLEMGLLSRLTGNSTYENIAMKALAAIWHRRSSLNLVGSEIDIMTGKWKSKHTGIGAGIDSFYETMLKSYVLLGDTNLYNWYDKAYNAVQKHTLHNGFNIEVDMRYGSGTLPYSYYFSSLQAFWPTLQTLTGHISDAAELFDKMRVLWNRFDALPEIFNIHSNSTISYGRDYPLRPELIESAYHLFLVTGDYKYVSFGQDILFMLQNRTRVKCGYASIADVETNRLDDRMDSYFLAETLKYLYLLFDEALPTFRRSSILCHPKALLTPTPHMSSVDTNSTIDDVELPTTNANAGSDRNAPEALWYQGCVDKKSMIFSTEGHIFLITQAVRKDNSRISTPSYNSKSLSNVMHHPTCQAV